jgi:DNA-binding CsgD family transcriptional regulator
MEVQLERAAIFEAARRGVGRIPWPVTTLAGVGRLGSIARWGLTGMLIASILALANSWLLDYHITRLLLAQSTARATDHVQLGILSHVTADDFNPPHSHERLAELKARLDPVLAPLSTNDPPTIDFDLVAADGTIVYSGLSGEAGLPALPGEQWLLDEALMGRVTGRLDSALSHSVARGDSDYDRAFDLYVPVSIDGAVVGAYELNVRLPPTPLNQPILSTGLGGVLGSGLYLVLRFANMHKRRHDSALPEPVDMTFIQQHEPSAMSEALDRLTQRELDVLRSLALGYSYRQIGAQLILSEETIRSHVKRILRKTGQPNRTALLTAALRTGIIDTPGRGQEPTVDEIHGRLSATGSATPPAIELVHPLARAAPSQIHPHGGTPQTSNSPAGAGSAGPTRVG